MLYQPYTAKIVRAILFSACILGLSACSTTRHGASEMGEDGMKGVGGNSAYAEGTDGSANGFQPSVSCNVPQITGAVTQSYYFDFNKSEVYQNDMSRLQAIASKVLENHAHLDVLGNTDDRGSREYNVALGWRRADAVTSVLKQAGISKQQINTNSNGAEKPIAFGNSDADYQCNRRVDVIEKE